MHFDPSLLRPLSPSNVRASIEVRNTSPRSNARLKVFDDLDHAGGGSSRPLFDEALNCDSHVTAALV